MELFNEKEVAFIIEKREQKGLQFNEIAELYNTRFKKNKTADNIKKTYYRYRDLASDQEYQVKNIKDIFRQKKVKSETAKENRILTDYLTKREDLMDEIKGVVSRINKVKINKAKKSSVKGKRNMTLELLFSDVHYGKLIKSIENNQVDASVIRQRVSKITKVVLDEVQRESKSFNIHKIIIAMIGDIIENAHFHGQESRKSSEFSSSKQTAVAIESMFEDLIKPIAIATAPLGIEVEIPCVTGNHDRPEDHKSYNDPGEENLTYIIYKTLEIMCVQAGFKHVKFKIALGLYLQTEIYGNTVVYEHGDELKNLNRDTIQNLMSKRGNQINKVVDYYRVGHWHEYTVYARGRMIVNGSVPGQDNYAENKGFASEAIQVLNYYVEPKTRKRSFFRSFPICLNPNE
jgi:predicted phosphodiesterase